ncbi:MAG TPA: hypothetical protein VKP69_34235 [Isosphaeraceae bacterium]|nr:hypothetical protein [Isosphaeraceae bacterium]
MATDQLKTAHEMRPFRPFTIHTPDGVAHPIPHPESLAYGPGSRTCITRTTVEPEPVPK